MKEEKKTPYVGVEKERLENKHTAYVLLYIKKEKNEKGQEWGRETKRI
jgi:hypothetical protein